MIRIATAGPADLDTIRDLAYTIWPVTYGHILSGPQLDFMLASFYSVEALTQSLQKGHNYLLVLENDKSLGFVGYEHGYKRNNVTRIHKIYVLPQTQGKGIGKMLIDHIEKLAREHRSDALSLNVNRQNNALGFYLRQGFTITGEEDIAIGHGYLMEDFTMEKPLKY